MANREISLGEVPVTRHGLRASRRLASLNQLKAMLLLTGGSVYVRGCHRGIKMGVHQLPNRRDGARRPSRAVATELTPAWATGRMYAICFDLDTAEAERRHPSKSKTVAYDQIERVFQEHGFTRMQGSVYFGREGTTPVQCVLAVQDLVRRYPSLRFIVRDIRMLRVEETNDLMPAINPQSDLSFDSAEGM